jgi:2-polyprenyl-6-hydroxyphenyl methylase/3-demethylubiquinone-9 3-methyltransferase
MEGEAVINNAFYEELSEKWLSAQDHPIALLRAENAIRNPWILSEISKRHSLGASFLDIGCGAGFLARAVQLGGYAATGIDLSESSLEIARKLDPSRKINYIKADAYALPFPDQSFDVVSAMDILEHVEQPRLLIAEASRVLKPGGTFFFHTFNRNLLSYLIIIKGVEWFVKNTPKNMHVYPLFIKPSELCLLCLEHHLHVEMMRGLRPRFFSLPFFKMLMFREVSPHFSFCFSKNLTTGYCGIATRSFYGSDHA